MPLEERVHRSNSNAGTAMISGVWVSEAVLIASQNPPPAASRGPNRLTMTTKSSPEGRYRGQSIAIITSEALTTA
jgi:hypothetical protein